MNRAERRRQERAAAKNSARKQPVIVGQGIVATELPGHRFEAKPMKPLPPKEPGKHRWIAIASYVVSDVQARDAMAVDIPKFLDHESMFDIGIGCWDCEEPLPAVGADSVCPAEASE